MQKEEFQHTAYTTNAYVTVGPLAKQVLQGTCVSSMINYQFIYALIWVPQEEH